MQIDGVFAEIGTLCCRNHIRLQRLQNCKFVQDLDFFQTQNRPLFSFVYACLEQLSAYLQQNRNSESFSSELDATIRKYNGDPLNFYPIFRESFEISFKKFNSHIPIHPSYSLFKACQVFDPAYTCFGTIERRNIRQYSMIRELAEPSEDLLREWSIYCGWDKSKLLGNLDLDQFWRGNINHFPLLSNIALNYIWLPISSCSVERSFSNYNNILSNDRQNLSENSLRSLNMLYFNK